MKQQSAKIRESSTVPILEINYRKQTKKKMTNAAKTSKGVVVGGR